MKKSNNIISEWLDKYGDPDIEKQVKKELNRMEKVMNKPQNATDVYTMLDAVICPNRCFNGMVKTFEYERALYVLVKCPYCKGKGKVSEQEAKRIDALL